MGYIDSAKDVARGMAQILIETEHLSDDKVRHWVTGPRRSFRTNNGYRGPVIRSELRLMAVNVVVRLDVPKLLESLKLIPERRGVDIHICLSGLPIGKIERRAHFA